MRPTREGFASLSARGSPARSGWHYAGRVSSGFWTAERMRIREDLQRRERKTPAAGVPATDRRDARWVTPNLVRSRSAKHLRGAIQAPGMARVPAR